MGEGGRKEGRGKGKEEEPRFHHLLRHIELVTRVEAEVWGGVGWGEIQ